MNIDDAINQACTEVGIVPPISRSIGRWIKTGTLSGRNGLGDGRVMINDTRVVSFNWQTGEQSTVWLKDMSSPAVRRQVRDDMEKHAEDKRRKAESAAAIASKLVAAATMQTHEYLAAKGFSEESVLVADAADIAGIAGKYLVPEGGRAAIVMPARIGTAIRSVQLIWESGSKKFLAHGETSGTSHRIATGRDCWLCEGFATGLSLRLALKALGHKATILCCFSASNIEKVATNAQGRLFVTADNDKPIEQFNGLGAGEFYAKRTGIPYLMPTAVGDDLNDMHQRDGIFAIQRLVCDFLKGVRK